MRGRFPVLFLSLVFASSLLAKDVYLSVSGKASGFFSDARIFNPSFDKDITVQARYLPSGNADNSGVAPVSLTIPKRTMKVYDDAVQSIFGGGAPLGAIRLTSNDDFVATQRIYQDAREGFQKGTLGQYVPGLDVTAAKTKGVLLQLKAGQASIGSFRTNLGAANPNATVANIAFKLYDRNNAVVGTNNLALQPFGVFSPTGIVPSPTNAVGFFGSPSSDLTDAWIGFTSDQPVFVYASVVDNGSVDPTFIPAADDSGTAPPPPPPQTKTVTIHASNGNFDVDGATGLAVNDEVKFVVTGSGGTHGIRFFSPEGAVLFTLDPLGATPSERTITLTAPGSYQYICTRPACSSGHSDMSGEFTVGPAGSPGSRDGY